MYQELKCKEVKGRKKYNCGWCGQLIEKNLRHHYRSYLFEGEFITDSMHNECFQAMLNASSDDLKNGWMPGDFERGKSRRKQ